MPEITADHKEKLADARREFWANITPEQRAEMSAKRKETNATKKAEKRSQAARDRAAAKKAERQQVQDFETELATAPMPGMRPAVDPEVAAIREYQEARRPKPPPAPPRPPAEPDPYVEAQAKVSALLKAEHEERLATVRRRAGIEPVEGADLPMSVMPRITVPDQSADGKEFVKPGWISRWVRQVDGWGRPSSNPPRMAEIRAWGGEPVRDENGEPITGQFGVLMQMPARRYVERIVRASPEGTFDRTNPETDKLRATIESTNSRAGREVAQFRGKGAVNDPNPGSMP